MKQPVGKKATEPEEPAIEVEESETPETEAETGTEGSGDSEVESREALERRARVQGWRPKAEYRGSAPWVDAETYLERGLAIQPILQQRLRDSEERERANAASMAEMRSAMDRLREMAETAETRARESAEREFAKQKRELETRRQEAARVADVAAVETVSREIEALKPPAAPARAAATQPSSPAGDVAEKAAVDAFVAVEPWFKSDPEAAAFASARYGSLQKSRPELSHSERLAEVKRDVVRRFPEHFENEAARRPAAVTTPSGGGSVRRSKGWTWEDVPADVRTQADRDIAAVNKGRKDGKTYTRADFVKIFFSGQEKQ